MSDSPTERPIDRLLAIMARLRDPATGCPWDVQQTFATIAPYTVEEAYEVADAIERGDLSDLRDELGDQVQRRAVVGDLLAEQLLDVLAVEALPGHVSPVRAVLAPYVKDNCAVASGCHDCPLADLGVVPASVIVPPPAG